MVMVVKFAVDEIPRRIYVGIGFEEISANPTESSQHKVSLIQAAGMFSCSNCDSSKLSMWYLHGPDRSTPYDVTLKAINDLHKEGSVPGTICIPVAKKY